MCSWPSRPRPVRRLAVPADRRRRRPGHGPAVGAAAGRRRGVVGRGPPGGGRPVGGGPSGRRRGGHRRCCRPGGARAAGCTSTAGCRGCRSTGGAGLRELGRPAGLPARRRAASSRSRAAHRRSRPRRPPGGTRTRCWRRAARRSGGSARPHSDPAARSPAAWSRCRWTAACRRPRAGRRQRLPRLAAAVPGRPPGRLARLGPPADAVGRHRAAGRRRSGRPAPSRRRDRARRRGRVGAAAGVGRRRTPSTRSPTGPAGGTCTGSGSTAAGARSRCARGRRSSATRCGSSARRTYGLLGDGRLLVRHGTDTDALGVLDPATGDAHRPGRCRTPSWQPLLSVAGDRVAGVAAGPATAPCGGAGRPRRAARVDRLRPSLADPPDPAYLPEPRAVTRARPRASGTCTRYVYPPRSPPRAAAGRRAPAVRGLRARRADRALARRARPGEGVLHQPRHRRGGRELRRVDRLRPGVPGAAAPAVGHRRRGGLRRRGAGAGPPPAPPTARGWRSAAARPAAGPRWPRSPAPTSSPPARRTTGSPS